MFVRRAIKRHIDLRLISTSKFRGRHKVTLWLVAKRFIEFLWLSSEWMRSYRLTAVTRVAENWRRNSQNFFYSRVWPLTFRRLAASDSRWTAWVVSIIALGCDGGATVATHRPLATDRRSAALIGSRCVSADCQMASLCDGQAAGRVNERYFFFFLLQHADDDADRRLFETRHNYSYNDVRRDVRCMVTGDWAEVRITTSSIWNVRQSPAYTIRPSKNPPSGIT